MLDIPEETEPHCCRPTALDQLARMEAKSDTTVDDVRSVSGMDGESRLCGATARWVRTAVEITLAGVILAVLVVAIVAGLLAVTIVGSGDAPRDGLDVPPRWGPYMP